MNTRSQESLGQKISFLPSLHLLKISYGTRFILSTILLTACPMTDSDSDGIPDITIDSYDTSVKTSTSIGSDSEISPTEEMSTESESTSNIETTEATSVTSGPMPTTGSAMDTMGEVSSSTSEPAACFEGVNCIHGSCSNEVFCVCNEPGYIGKDCNQCEEGYDDVGREGKVLCVDITDPNPPVIETNNGQAYGIFNPILFLYGTCEGADTNTIWFNQDGGGWENVDTYIAGDTEWEIEIPMEADAIPHTFCVAAEDESLNMSTTDCIDVTRLA